MEETVQCTGNTKGGKPCKRMVVIQKECKGNEPLCWEHQDLLLHKLAEERKKQRIPKPPKVFSIEINKKEERLKELSKDEENVHTPEINDILQKSIENLKIWALQKNIKIEKNLSETIESFLLSNQGRIWRGNDKVNGAIVHLRECYQFNDPLKLLGVSYPELSSWVWHRIMMTEDYDKKQFLLERFFEEIFEGTKLCLNGNMARLINVFACIDDEINPQDGSKIYTPEILHTSIYNIIQEQELELDDMIHKIRGVLFEAKVNVDDWGDWLDAAIEEKLNSFL